MGFELTIAVFMSFKLPMINKTEASNAVTIIKTRDETESQNIF
jgi:hypothetical protein